MEKIRVIRVGSPKHKHAKKADLIKKKSKPVVVLKTVGPRVENICNILVYKFLLTKTITRLSFYQSSWVPIFCPVSFSLRLSDYYLFADFSVENFFFT